MNETANTQQIRLRRERAEADSRRRVMLDPRPVPSRPPSFAGVAPYVEEAARRLEVDPLLYGRTTRSWHIGQVQDMLGQLEQIRRNPHAPDHALADSFGHVVKVIASLRAGLDGCIAAAREAAEANGIDASYLDVLASLNPPTRRKPPQPETLDGQL